MKGSTWHRWDLHYHTPSSYDHHNKSKTNQEIVDELLADNVSAVVISDHHRIDFSRINELNKIANGKIKFFRGIENISYESGSIENPEIRDKICKILEGGKDAFINRERRYNFKL